MGDGRTRDAPWWVRGVHSRHDEPTAPTPTPPRPRPETGWERLTDGELAYQLEGFLAISVSDDRAERLIVEAVVRLRRRAQGER